MEFFFLVSFSDCCYCGNAAGFVYWYCILQPCWIHLLALIVFCVCGFCRIYYVQDHAVCNEEFFISGLHAFSFCCLFALARIPVQYWLESATVNKFVLLILGGKLLVFLWIMIAVGFFFNQVRKFSAFLLIYR